jgi:hypothetical protein
MTLIQRMIPATWVRSSSAGPSSARRESDAAQCLELAAAKGRLTMLERTLDRRDDARPAHLRPVARHGR